jgi:glycosyltransferase involved in cell wall biosynthesis
MACDKVLWISWAGDGSIRSRVLARELHAQFRNVALFYGKKHFAALRYLSASIGTLVWFLIIRPRVVVVQCPSIALALLASMAKAVFRYKLVVDLHSLPIGKPEEISNKILFFALSRSDVILVTNEPYRDLLLKTSGILTKTLLLPDKIPDFEYPHRPVVMQGRYNILYTGGFSEFDPGYEIVGSLKFLSKEYWLYITGKNDLKQGQVPENCTLLGFVSDETYQNYLRTVDVVVVLTNNQFSLVCGAYESIAAGKPLVLSDTAVLRSYFGGGGVIFSANNSKAIAVAIETAAREKDQLVEEMHRRVKVKIAAWQEKWKVVADEFGSL